MSKLARRNATVEVVDAEDGSTYIKKRYHAVYTASQEYEAYGCVSGFYRDCPGVRTARLIDIDEEDNSLLIEFIPGESLYDSAADGDLRPLCYWHEILITPFVQARDAGLPFDSDPSNYIVHADTGELVNVDPVCADVRIDDYPAVVFLWGIIKLILRTTKFWRYPALFRIARNFLALYQSRCELNADNFNSQMTTYIDVVISWNKQINRVDSIVMIVIRRCLAIPLYSLARFAFRHNLVRPKILSR